MELICLDNSFTKVLKSLDIFTVGKKDAQSIIYKLLQEIYCSHPIILQIVLLKSTADKLKHLKVAVFVQHWKVSREIETAFASTILQEMM